MAVERYHITDKGEVDLCRSDPSNPRSTGCRFKDEFGVVLPQFNFRDEFGVVLPHFDSVEDAQGYLDAQNASRQIPAAVSKPAVEAVAQEVVEPVAALQRRPRRLLQSSLLMKQRHRPKSLLPG